MTEHSAAIFVFFFLAEYASIVLICIFTCILYIGGYLDIITLDLINLSFTNFDGETSLFSVLIQGLNTSLNLGFKACIMIFTFI
jgi:NADH:ubiquinone oxidoreductase subunit H